MTEELLMTHVVDDPADTTMMRIVHDALRRDLERARAALHPDAPRHQRVAIGGHLGWMMRFLHAHHASEDLGLYALVRSRAGDAPDEVAVLDRMAHDHDVVAVAAAGLETAAATLATGPDDAAVRATRVALDALTSALLPHLRAEESAAMPIVSRRITGSEWSALEQQYNLDPKTTSALGFEGHWLIDDATDADRTTVLALVPPIPRFVLLHGYARRYRRHTAACWHPADRPPRRVQLADRVEVVVDADIDAVWNVVIDVTRVGEWSHECVRADWVGTATHAVPGARFRGRNRAGILRWGRVCEVLSADEYELRWRTVPSVLYPDSSEWTISLTREGTGTRIAQSYHAIRAPRILVALYALLVPDHRDRTDALLGDLRRLGDVALAAGRAPTAPSA